MYEKYNKFLKRKWMILNEQNFQEFLNSSQENKVIIVKPLGGEGGKGIEKFEYKMKKMPKQFITVYYTKNNY